ncbi:MAG: OadG family protein [Pseudobutyrivibrio sp.]|nr:OadG family protein [Pseudobutyrivibrio sp.]
MRKKLLLLLTTLVLALNVVACGNKGDETYGGYTTESYNALTQLYMNYAVNLDEKEYDQATEYFVNYGLSQLGDAEAVKNAGLPDFLATSFVGFDQLMESYKECKDVKVGEFVKFEDVTVEKSGKTITATLISNFTERNLKTTFVFKANDVNAGPTAIDVEPVYTLGETMSKAGLNTIMGILIVFTMLVIMSGVIKCFEIIPKLEKRAKDKKEGKTAANEVVVPAAAPVAQAKNETDDLQLIAVIAAAIAASTGASTDSFVVRSIKKR